MDVGTLTAFLRLDRSDFEQGAGEAEGQAESLGSRMSGTLTKGAKVAGAALAAGAAAAVTGAFKFASMGDELDKTSAKLGVHTDFLQDARHWASQNGIEHSAMERAVGRLNQRIGRAADGNDKYAEAFEAVGVSIHDAGGEIRDTESVMRDTIDALQGIEDPAQQSAAASEIFGTKMARDLMPALRDGSLTLEEATAAMDGHGRMTEEQIKQAAEFSDAWDNIKTAAMSLVREGFMPVMGVLADRVFPFIQDRFIPALQQLREWLGPRLEAAGRTISAFLTGVLVPAFAALSAWWQENGPAIIARAEALWDGLQAAFGQVQGLIERVVGWFQSGESETTGTMANILGFVQDTWPQIQEVITTAVELIWTVVEKILGVLENIWDQWGETILSIVQRIFGLIQTVIQSVLRVIQGIIDTVLGVITGDWSRAWDGIRNILGGVWDLIKGIVSAAVGVVRDVIANVIGLVADRWRDTWTGIRTFLADTWDGIKTAVSDGIGSVLDWFRDLPGRIANAIRGLPSTMRQAGRDTMNGLWDGLKAVWDRIMGWVERQMDRLPSAAKKVLGISSPSKVFMEIGEDTFEGMRLGLERAMPDLGGMIEVPDAAVAGRRRGGDGASQQGPLEVTLDLGEGITQRWRIERTREGRGRAVRMGAR